MELDRSSSAPSPRGSTTTTILIDGKLSDRLHCLIWTKNSAPVLRIGCDGPDTTISWIDRFPKANYPRKSPISTAIVVLIVAMIIAAIFAMMIPTRSIPDGIRDLLEMKELIKELRKLPEENRQPNMTAPLVAHLADINRYLHDRVYSQI